MKVLIISDSHRSQLLTDILKKERNADIILHLGDGSPDMLDTGEYTGGKPVYTLKGNCDLSSYNFPAKLISFAGKAKFFACHGHAYNVKEGLSALFYAAKEAECAFAFYGHTHIPHIEKYEDVTLFNPGAVMNGRYGIMEINGDSITLQHRSL